MDSFIDMHVHTTASDGTFTPSEVVDLAHEIGLSAIAITDHDTVSGFAEAERQSELYGMEIIPGIEFSTKYKGRVHLLGYYIDTKCSELLEELDNIVKDRDKRNEKIVDLMRQDGIDISYDGMKERFGEVIGRPHFATILVENGFAPTTKDAFEAYVGKGKKYWLPRSTITMERCIELIRIAGGTPILAHLFEYKYDTKSLQELIEYCFSIGISGVEVRHPSHTLEQMMFLEEQCDMRGIVKTGGSDFHGSVKLDNPLGVPQVPHSWLREVRKAAVKI